MVGLLIVSHSRALGEALLALIRQVAPPEVPLGLAAGAGEAGAEFGTDALAVAEAIRAMPAGEGVVVLMDLGSAVLSAELALDFLPEELRKTVRLCPAPLVEGALAAAVCAGAGGDLDSVADEASQAIQPKQEHLASPILPPGSPENREATVPQPALELDVTVTNLHGLHARPAARLVQAAATYDAEVWVTNLDANAGPASARSLNSLAALGVRRGQRIRIFATGKEAPAALQTLGMLVASGFGMPLESERAAESSAASLPAAQDLPDHPLLGTPVCTGIALGPVFVYRPTQPLVLEQAAGDLQLEWERLQAAIRAVRQSIQARIHRWTAGAGASRAAIFEAHLLMMDDPTLLARSRQLIFEQGMAAGPAWQAAVEAAADRLRSLEDAYLRTRAGDVLDVGRQVLLTLSPETSQAALFLPEPGILVAAELSPTEAAQLDPRRVLGVVTARGGSTSHAAILLRSLEIPAVSGIELPDLPPHLEAGLDGGRGALWLNPSPERRMALQSRRAGWLREREALLRLSRLPAQTRDGRRIVVAANVGSLADAMLALQNGAEAVGVLRTEFLYLTHQSAPTEDEQLAGLAEIFARLGELPVVVRTLDAGGDKDMPYLDLPAEANPYLGLRAIRLSLRYPELLRCQLRAALRAGARSNLRVMFPMVASLEELLQGKHLLEQVHTELEQAGQPHCWPVQVGMMVEIPSAALLAGSFAPHVDFFSIGTNDLAQYTLAAERGNPDLGDLLDALHPAVLSLVSAVVLGARPLARPVAICGEAASDPLAAPLLVGLGVDELSVNPASIPEVKNRVRQLEAASAAKLAQTALECTSAAQVRRLAQEYIESLPENPSA